MTEGHQAHRRQMLQHCLWMASMDPTYAQWAADKYERESAGALEGLSAKVKGEIAKRKAKGAADAASSAR